MKFRKRPVVIEALQLRWETWNQMCEFANIGELTDGKPQGCYIGKDGLAVGSDEATDEIGLLIPTLEGLMTARQGAWIIKGVAGELYPWKPDIFEATYEAVYSYKVTQYRKRH
jgi:hypothetical protein